MSQGKSELHSMPSVMINTKTIQITTVYWSQRTGVVNGETWMERGIISLSTFVTFVKQSDGLHQ